MSEPFDLMGFLDEPEDLDGDQGWICQIEVEPGYSVNYSVGLGIQERFFSAVEYGADDAKEMARALKETRSDGKVEKVVRLTMYADSVVNRDEVPSWKNGRWPQDVTTWKEEYTELFREPLERAFQSGLTPGQKHWAQVARLPEPYEARTKPDLEDDEKTWIRYIARLFDSEEEAREAAGDSEVVLDSRLPEQPDAWNEAVFGSWNDIVQKQVDFLKEKTEIDLSGLVSDDIGLTMEVLEQIRAIAREDEVPF
jgi:hypothetical protein